MSAEQPRNALAWAVNQGLQDSVERGEIASVLYYRGNQRPWVIYLNGDPGGKLTFNTREANAFHAGLVAARVKYAQP